MTTRRTAPDLRFELYCRITAMFWSANVETGRARQAILAGREPLLHLALATQTVEHAVSLALTLHGRRIAMTGSMPRYGDRRSDLEILTDIEASRPEDPYADLALCARDTLALIERARAFDGVEPAI